MHTKHLKASISLVFAGVLLIAVASQAQPAKGANKFLGNITTSGAVRSDFMTYWNQITPENEAKWGSVEGTRGTFKWTGVDNVKNFAETNHIPWKFHNLCWGQQQPGWLSGLSAADQLMEIGKWMDSAAKRYPNVDMIDVFNEAEHNSPPYKTALGGAGTTGYDWVIKAFQMARQRWPHSILIYNDYNNCEYKTDNAWTVNLVKAFKKANAPLDAIGCQCHDVWMSSISAATVKGYLDSIAATGIPIVVSEFDLPITSDATQLSTMQAKFPILWNHPAVVGVTYWGYLVGATWKSGSGLLNTNGTQRPAMAWMLNYVTANPNPPNNFPNLLHPGTGVKHLTAPATRDFMELHGTVLQMTEASKNPTEIAIYRPDGRLVRKFTTLQHSIDIGTSLSRGCYAVQVAQAGRQMARKMNVF